MKKKILFVISIVFILIIGFGVYFLLNRERKEETQVNDNIIEKLEKENKIANFNFETKSVKLNSGYVMPLNGLGTYSLTGDTCYNAVTSALKSGVRLIDTAYMYGNEEEIGRAIRDSKIPRNEIFVITKIYPTQFDNPKEAIELALKKLDIDYIDMMLLHHPGDSDVKAYIGGGDKTLFFYNYIKK